MIYEIIPGEVLEYRPKTTHLMFKDTEPFKVCVIARGTNGSSARVKCLEGRDKNKRKTLPAYLLFKLDGLGACK